MTEPETPATLGDRIAAARTRSDELAAGAAARARDFVHEHPVASVAGGIVVGALIAGLLTRRSAPAPRREETETPEAGARLARLAALGAEFALAFAARAAEAGKDGLGRVEETLEHLGESAGHTGAEAGRRVAGLADLVIAALRARLGKRG